MVDRRTYETPHGPGRIVQRRATRPWAALVLTHGAGGGIDAHELDALSHRLPALGISVALVEMPWKVAGKKIAPSPRILDQCFLALANHLRPQSPLIVGGRSAGARVACRTGRGLGAVGVVALSFPLHPPGKPEKSRADEIASARLPVLVVQGERDPFGIPSEFAAGTPIVQVPAADHSLRVARTAAVSQDETVTTVVDAVHGWIATRLGHDTSGNK